MADSATAGCSTLHVAINSLAQYQLPRSRLLEDLRAAGVPMRQVHVFVGGALPVPAAGAWQEEWDGVRFYTVLHNSVDFTAMVHIVEHPELFRGVAQWFYLHDTCSVGRGFWSNITRWCSRLPTCALPLTRYSPSSSMGLYSAAFLAHQRASVVALKNANGAPAEKWKKRGFGWEDRLFKVCDAQSPVPVRRFTRRCWNATISRRTCICSQLVIDEHSVKVYANDSTPRQAWRFPCADVVKYKANYRRNVTMALRP